MGFTDIFKSKEQREKDRKTNQRKAMRKSEMALETVNERIAKLTTDRDSTWARAAEYLKAGQKPGAERELQKYRSYEVLITQMEKKKWIFEYYTIRIENAETDNAFAEAMTAIDKVIKIDPEKIMSSFDAIDDKLEDQTEIDKYFDKLHDKKLGKVATQEVSTIVSVDQMMAQLESEVAHQVSGLTGTNAPSTKEAITSGREALSDLLKGE